MLEVGAVKKMSNDGEFSSLHWVERLIFDSSDFMDV
jgi:hypothetical protein